MIPESKLAVYPSTLQKGFKFSQVSCRVSESTASHSGRTNKTVHGRGMVAGSCLEWLCHKLARGRELKLVMEIALIKNKCPGDSGM